MISMEDRIEKGYYTCYTCYVYRLYIHEIKWGFSLTKIIQMISLPPSAGVLSCDEIICYICTYVLHLKRWRNIVK